MAALFPRLQRPRPLADGSYVNDTHLNEWSFLDTNIPTEVPVPTIAQVDVAVQTALTAHQHIPSILEWAQAWRCRLIRPLWTPPDERQLQPLGHVSSNTDNAAYNGVVNTVHVWDPAQETQPYHHLMAHPYIWDPTLFDSRFRPLINKAHSFTPYQHEAALTSKLDLQVFPDLQAVQYFLAYLHQHGRRWPNNHDALFSETGSSAFPHPFRFLPDRGAFTSDRRINQTTRCCGEIKPSYKWSSSWSRTLAPGGSLQLRHQYLQVLSQVKGYMILCGSNDQGLAPIYSYVISEEEVVLMKRIPGQGMHPGPILVSRGYTLQNQPPLGHPSGMLALVYIHLLAGSLNGLAVP